MFDFSAQVFPKETRDWIAKEFYAYFERKKQCITQENVDDGEANEWDAVFEEIMRRIERDRDTERLIHMTFRDKLHDYSVYEELYIGRTTYYTQRKAILEQAGVIAVKLGVLDPWKY